MPPFERLKEKVVQQRRPGDSSWRESPLYFAGISFEKLLVRQTDFFAVRIRLPNTMQTIQLINNSDSGNKMEILCYPNLQISIDCKYCIITDGTISGIVDYKDLGWKDAGNIYWTRLKDGVNLLTIKGECNLIITYDIPLKRAGDFV